MTTGTKIFRTIISILLVLTMLWSIFVGLGLYAFGSRLIHTDEYGIWVCPNGGEYARKIFRVGHIGELTVQDNQVLSDALHDLVKRNILR